ncbi:MAG: ABC transporter permease [Anaerolineae bacterium]
MLNQVFAVAVRVLHQLARDRRFVAFTLIVPLLVIYMLDIFFESAQNPMIRPKEFIVPLGAFIVHFLTYLLCAIVLVRERTAHTLARMFVNGFERGAIIGGYIIAYSVLATLQSLIVLFALQAFFELNFDLGVMVLIFGIIWMLAVISIALGIFVSNFARNEGQIFPFIPLVILPSIFFSGLILPIDRLPEWASPLVYVAPLYYATEAIRGLTDNGGNISMWLGLPLYGVAVLALAMFTLREQE